MTDPALPGPSTGDAETGRLRQVVEHLLPIETLWDATRLLLKVEGYKVLIASSVAEVRKCVREHPGIELLITDYHLRDGETGMEVILLLRDLIGPASKAILVTGDTSSVVRDLHKDHRLRIARKPIGADELLGMMRSLLAT
jgi:DNA-binding NtrC family response regulator